MADTEIENEEQPTDIRSMLEGAVAEAESDAVEQEEGADEKGDKEEGSAAEDGAAKPEAEEKPEDKPEAETKDKDAKEADAAKAAKDAKPEAPANWSAADKKMFGEATPAQQRFLLDRHKSMEADYTKKTQAVAALKAEYEPVEQMFAPHREGMAKAGFTPRTLIQAWAKVEERLMKGEGVEVLAGTASAYKVDPILLATRILKGANIADPDKVVADIMAGVKGGAADDPWAGVSPALRAELEGIKARQAADDRLKEQTAEEAQRAELERINTEVETFKNATDKDGTPLHPYFEEVTDDMVALANVAKASKQVLPLEELYTRAIWANPVVRAKILATQQAASQTASEIAQQAEREKAKTETKDKARQAKRAGSSVTGSPGIGQAASRTKLPDMSLRETLAAAAAEAEASASQ